MISLRSLFLTCLAGTAAAIYGLKQPGADDNNNNNGGTEGVDQKHLPGCGELDIFFTGLPAHHPYVKAIGLDTNMVDRALRSEARSVLKAGYNLRVSLAGPEQGISPIRSQFEDLPFSFSSSSSSSSEEEQPQRRRKNWDGTGMGFGMRSMKRDDVTLLMTDELDMFRRGTGLEAPIMFNYNATTFLWALKKYLPLAEENCEGREGRDLGYTEFCDICGQEGGEGEL